jgi:proteasome beta subunit
LPAVAHPEFAVPHGTTIVALTFRGGVLIAGDRRATIDNVIAQRDLEKVVVIDDTTAAGFAGAVGPAVQMLKLFAFEVEHYEKVEGTSISFPGKVNRLAAMLRENLDAVEQGFVAVPLLVGFDPERGGRIVSFDISGNIAENRSGYKSIGSGSPYAEAALKKRHDPDADLPGAIRAVVEALWDAADEDTATGGPDLVRGIYPLVVSVTGAEGTVRRPEEEIAAIARDVVRDREANPGG